MPNRKKTPLPKWVICCFSIFVSHINLLVAADVWIDPVFLSTELDSNPPKTDNQSDRKIDVRQPIQRNDSPFIRLLFAYEHLKFSSKAIAAISHSYPHISWFQSRLLIIHAWPTMVSSCIIQKYHRAATRCYIEVHTLLPLFAAKIQGLTAETAVSMTIGTQTATAMYCCSH